MARDMKRDRCKTRILFVMGDKCCICGYNKSFAAMDLHHIDPSTKKFSVGKQNFYNQKWLTVSEELKKCILLCANCHREVHNGFAPKNMVSSFSQQNSDLVFEEIQDMKANRKRFCKECNNVVSREEGVCSKCGTTVYRNIKTKGIKEPFVSMCPSKELLKELIYTISFWKIGVQFSVSDNAVRKWCKKYDLPFRKTDIKQYTKEEWADI